MIKLIHFLALKIGRQTLNGVKQQSRLKKMIKNSPSLGSRLKYLKSYTGALLLQSPDDHLSFLSLSSNILLRNVQLSYRIPAEASQRVLGRIRFSGYASLCKSSLIVTGLFTCISLHRKPRPRPTENITNCLLALVVASLRCCGTKCR